MNTKPYDVLPDTVPLTDDIADSTNVEEQVAHRELLERMFAGLDAREHHILEMIAQEYTTEEILDELGFAPRSSYGRELVAAVRAKARGFRGEL